MRIRRVEIQNFRGIQHLDMRIPADQNFICLIGPGDSAKSTILDAIHLTLGERWSLALSDTDFYNGSVDEPIIIRVAVTDVPEQIKNHAVLGMQLSGITADGEWSHDPSDDVDECVIVQLSVDRDMDPEWSAYRPGGDEHQHVGAGHRRKFAVFKVDDRVDNHLRWTRTSALTKLTDTTHGTAGTLAAALIAAREAVGQATTPELIQLTADIGKRMGQLGSGSFTDLRPGLDTSLSSAGGNLALFEGTVPLTSYGLGTRRLAGLATQEMASANKSVLLVDEVEHGLEPHRLVHLLNYLKLGQNASQVFVTTHSPVAVEQLAAGDLAIVRCSGGSTSVGFVPSDLDFAQSTLRGVPSAFLARKVAVTEGKTEFGLLLGLGDSWDAAQAAAGKPTRSAFGVAISDGNGSNAPGRATALLRLGYDVLLLMDNDDRSVDAKIAQAKQAGVDVLRWAPGLATEHEVVAPLDARQLSSLLTLAADSRVDEATVRSDLLNHRAGGPAVAGLDVAQWIDSGAYTLAESKALIAKAALKCRWFKNVGAGQLLARFVVDNQATYATSNLMLTLAQLKTFIYAPDSSAGTLEDPASSGETGGSSA